MEILLLIVGLAIGCAVGYVLGRSKVSVMESQLKMQGKEVELLQTHHREALNMQQARFDQAISMQQARFDETISMQQARFDETIGRMSAQLKAATNDMLKQSQREFAETSNVHIGQIVNPLRETIGKMQEAMADNTLKQTSMSSAVRTSIEAMMRQSEATRKSAEELARVFKYGTKIQGDWGETVLDELLTSQGLRRGVHYDTQATIRDAKGNAVKSDTGSTMRPDVILHLDQKRELIIDSKVSLTAFIEYVNAENEVDRDRYLKAHVESVNRHVRELAQKDYTSYIQSPKVKMDYVIMFVPHSGALWTALNAQPDLWRRAMERNVFIADEQTLFAALKIINLTWTQITQVQQHEKVYKLAEEMLDRVGQFVKKYEALGRALDAANKAFAEGQKKLDPQGQSILGTSAKLIKMGAKQSAKNPIPQLVDVDDLDIADETPLIE